MDKFHKVITCASYGGTGSSVITDLLKEFNNLKSLGDYEFAIAHEIDGISDLQHFLLEDFHRLKVDEGIYRFKKLIYKVGKGYNQYFNNQFYEISENYINKLTDLSWNGYWHQHLYRQNKLATKFIYTMPTIFQQFKHKYSLKKGDYEFVPYVKRSEMYFSYPGDKFFDITKEYMENLFNAIDSNYSYDYLVLDQLVPPTNTERYLMYFNSLKVIVVDRDPRDLYLLNKLFWKEGWIPTDDVKIFVSWYKLMREHVKHEKEDPSKVMRVQFEDFIFNYDEMINKIISFLGITSENHVEKRKYFNPDRSIKNCKLWEKYNSFGEDIKFIESHLGEFCYNHK